MAMGICRQGSLSGDELGREIPSAVRGTVQLPFFFNQLVLHLLDHHPPLPVAYSRVHKQLLIQLAFLFQLPS
ncbi:hypothetical protein Hanom_Chr03g00190911 [Helianthus anomalus]